jgi:hypothetical protein
MAQNFIDFTKEQQVVIADFVHAYDTDTLIVTEAEKLLDVLHQHSLLDNYRELKQELAEKKTGITDRIKNILFNKVSEQQGVSIMNEYYKGNLI